MSKGRFSQHKIEKGVTLILEGLGVDLDDQNYLETPERVAKMYAEVFNREDTEFATFEETTSDFILMKWHKMFGFCPHHLLPVELHVALAYIPDGKVLGLSKLIRILNVVNRGPLLQEAFTSGVLEALHDVLPKMQGAGIIVRGQHGCSKVRGVQSDAWFTTYKFIGKMEEDLTLQNRFFQLVL